MSLALVPLAAEDVHARRRPAIIVFVWVWEAMLALVIATPVHTWARRAFGEHPDGDAVLFRPGARALLTWLGQTENALPIVSRTTLVLLLVSAVASQLVLGAMIASLAFARNDAPRAPRIVDALRAGVRSFLPLAGLLAFAAIAQGLLLGAGLFVSSALDHRLATPLGDARSFTLRLVVLALFLVLALVAGVFVDLARAAVGRDVELDASAGATRPAWNTMLLGVKAALRVSRRGKGLVGPFFAWAWRALAGLALLAVGALASSALGGRGGVVLVALAVIHQLVVVLRVALRASWLARAVRFVVPVQNAWTAEAAVVQRGADVEAASAR